MSDEHTRRDPHDCSGDAAAYVLGALEPAEAEAFRRHLDSCAVCRDEVAAFERTVDVLPAAVRQYRAPATLRRQVLRGVHEQPHPAGSGAGASEPSRRIPRPSRPWLAGAGALAAAAVVLAIVLSLGGTSPRVIAASVTGPGSAQVKVSAGRAELILRGFPAPPPGEIYEVWLQHGSATPRPTRTLFSVTRAGEADVGVAGALGGVSRLMVTAERAGGSEVPTHAPVIVAQFKS